MIHTLINFVAFQLCWFASVLGAAHAMPWLGPVAAIVWMTAHLFALRADAAIEIQVLIAAAVIGFVADSTLVLAGMLEFPQHTRLGGPSPLWMVALWVAFAATLRHALGWLRGRWFLGAALGAVGGPLAYLGGEALGAIAIAGVPALIAVAAQYAVATPVLLMVAQRAERARRTSAVDVAPGVQP